MTLAGLRIGLVTARASRAGGGVFEAVVRQAAVIRAAGGEVEVFAAADADAAADRARFGDVPVSLLRVMSPARLGWMPGLARALTSAQLDLVHLHGIWTAASAAAARWARATGRPLVVSPHGMLDPWITARGRWKKSLARLGWERRAWAAAAALHALTDAEAGDIGAETGRRATLVIPNAGPPVAPAPGADREAGFLYLGRIHPKKNLEGLLAAWALLDRPQATLTIAGWGDASAVSRLERAIAAAGTRVRFVGAVHGAAKAALLAQARWLVLPSWSEGLPMVVLEAWASGLPAILTDACHLPDGFATGAALQCEPTPASIAAALAAALATDEAAWRKRQAAALALAAGPFSADAVAARWVDAYRSLTSQAA